MSLCFCCQPAPGTHCTPTSRSHNPPPWHISVPPALSNSQHSWAAPETNVESEAIAGVLWLLKGGASTFLPVLSSLPLDVYLHHLPCISLGQPSKLAHHRSTGEVRWERPRWEGASGGHLPNLSSGRNTQTGVPSPTLMQILEMSKNGDSTASLHPVPVLDHPHRRKMFADVQSELPVFHFVPTASAPGTG